MKLSEIAQYEDTDDLVLGVDSFYNGVYQGQKINVCKGGLDASQVGLSTLYNLPTKVLKDVSICLNDKLSSLEHGPTEVGGSFNCARCAITSLEHAPLKVDGNFYADNNKITSLEGIGRRYIKSLDGNLIVYHNPIVSNVLGAMLIKGIQELRIWAALPVSTSSPPECKTVSRIVNESLRDHLDVLECKEALMEAGLKDYAKL